MDSWFREIRVPRVWRVSLATELDFCRKKKRNRACFGSIGARSWRQPPSLPLFYEGKVMKTIFPENYEYVLKTTTTRRMERFLVFIAIL